ncbi:hypothetical protein FZC66_07620 [Priestia megaterium]|nr:hypothetical protein FZC66_07620 [Priestia megaterium]
MKVFLGVLLISIVILVVELPKLLKMDKRKDMYFFLIFLLLSTVMNIVYYLQLPVPNPLDWLTTVLQPLTKLTKSG